MALSDKTQYKYFFRTIPTQVIIADAMLEFASKEGWKKLGILYTDDPLGQQCNIYIHQQQQLTDYYHIVYQRAIIQAGTMDIHITQYQSIPTNSDQQHDGLNSALKNLTDSGARIIMVVANPTSKIMIRANQLGLVNENYVWLLMGDAEEDLKTQVDVFNTNHTPAIDYASAFQGLFMFDNWLGLYGYPPFESFLDQWAKLNPQM